MRVLIDTCVILDTLQGRKPFNNESDQIFIGIANMQINGFVTSSSTTDIYYLMHKHYHNQQKTRSDMVKLFDFFNILDTYGEDCQNAILNSSGDYEDNLIIETAKRCDIDCIVTRNIKDYAASPVPVMTPAEFLSRSATRGN